MKGIIMANLSQSDRDRIERIFQSTTGMKVTDEVKIHVAELIEHQGKTVWRFNLKPKDETVVYALMCMRGGILDRLYMIPLEEYSRQSIKIYRNGKTYEPYRKK